MFKKVTSAVFLLILLTACTTEEVSQQENEPQAPSEAEHEETEIVIPDSNLQKLDEGEAVAQLQEALNQIGYNLEINGIYDDTTTWAITDLQLQHDDLSAIGVYNEETSNLLENILAEGETIEAGAGLPMKSEPVFTDSGTEVTANPYDLLVLVNKEHALPEDFIPEDLVIPNVRFPFTEELPKKQMRKSAADALEEMFQQADEEELDLFAQSGYRSYERQDAIFASNADQHGEEAANQFSARPGESEHQTGLTMDVTSPDVNYQLVEAFGETDEGKWIQENAQEFGFIIRYPEGKEETTGYQYEPWHLRYVGEKAAKEITSQEITLEEYLNAAD